MGAAQAKEGDLKTPEGSPISMPPGFLPPAAAAIAKQQGVTAQTLTFDSDCYLCRNFAWPPDKLLYDRQDGQ